jgi:biopolymer transport protein ExbD
MAPLIDCVFLLLTFFLCASTLKKAHREVQVDLPHAAAAITTKSKFDTVVIQVTQDGNMYIEGQPISTRLLHKRLQEAAAESPDRRVRIDGDRRTAFQHIVHILDLCQFVGLNNVGVRARDEQEILGDEPVGRPR